MKLFKTYLLILLCCHALSAAAQGKLHDIIVLKNGTTYTGQIIQIIPDSLYKIEILGGNVIAIRPTDIQKLYKEKDFDHKPQYKVDTSDGMCTIYRPSSVFYRYRPRGYFFQLHLHAMLDFGVHMVHGYRFNQWAFLGLGVGIQAITTPLPLTDAQAYSVGAYVPVYAWYSGDMIRNRITPYYSLSAGYAFPVRSFSSSYTSPMYGSTVRLDGGAISSVGLGARFYGRRVYHSLGALLSIQQTSWHRDDYNNGGSSVSHTYTSRQGFLLIPSFDIGICF